MRRADRLFQIIQILRRSPRPVTATALAEELEVSKRSVYRDVADLIGQRVPIRGEAGVGYVLDRDFDMPPLMLTPDELEAAALGAQWVADKGDVVLAAAARDLIAKIAAVVPDELLPFLDEPSVGAPPSSCEDRRRSRHRPEPVVDSRREKDPHSLQRRADARERTDHLAGDDRLRRNRSDACGLVRAAPGFPPFPHGPHPRGRVSRRAARRRAARTARPLATRL